MLHIHRAERADGLADALGELLAVPLADPFAPEVVSVPTRGMERWLSQRLSASLGRRKTVTSSLGAVARGTEGVLSARGPPPLGAGASLGIATGAAA